MKKRFSIIIPAYNIEDYIEKSINSVKKQTFNSYEIIVIDDASIDNTVDKIKKYDDIIFIRHKINKGLGGARNTGLRFAKGEYIIFLDGDDYLSNNDVLAKIDKLINNNKPDVIYMGFKIEGNRKETVIPTIETCTKNYKVARDPYPNVWSKCWSMKFIKDNKLKFPEKRYYEDVLFIYKGIMKVKNYLIADFPVHTYISGRKNSITTTLSFKNIYDTIDNIKDMIELKNENETEEIKIKIKKEIDMCKKRLKEVAQLN